MSEKFQPPKILRTPRNPFHMKLREVKINLEERDLNLEEGFSESQKLELKKYISQLKKEIWSHLEFENSKNPKNSQTIKNIKKLTELNMILIMDVVVKATYIEKLRNYNNVLVIFEEWEISFGKSETSELDSLKIGILELLQENSQAEKLKKQELQDEISLIFGAII